MRIDFYLDFLNKTLTCRSTYLAINTMLYNSTHYTKNKLYIFTIFITSDLKYFKEYYLYLQTIIFRIYE